MIGRVTYIPAARSLGVVLVLVGAQWLGYERAVTQLAETSQAQLSALRLEVTDNREANAGLRALQDAWDASTDDELRREFVALRDRVSERFLMDREAAMADFFDSVQRLAPPDSTGELRALRQQGERISNIYANRSAAALEYIDSPPWYLQPTAAVLGDDQRRHMHFNAALHALFVGELDAALEALVELRQQPATASEIAPIDYALARLHLARFTDEQAVDGLGQSLGLVKESIRAAPGDAMSLLLLDYLLAIDSAVKLVEMETAEGQGSGQGDGKRGALADSSGEF